MKTTTALLAATLLTLVGARAEAGDEATAFDSVLAGLPAPSAAAGFKFEGEMLANGTPLGEVSMAAYPGKLKTGQAVWSVDFALSAMGGQVTQKLSCGYDAHLTPLRGKFSGTTPAGATETWWKRVPEGVRLGLADDATLVEHPAPFLSASVPSLLLFCRLVGFRAADWKGDLFDDKNQKFVAATWTTEPEGTYGGAKARVVRGRRADGKTLEAGFDAATGALLGVKLGDEKGMFEMRPAGAAQPAGDGDVFSRPAKTAQEAAVQGMLAFAVADFDLLERVVHWPSIHALVKGAPEAAGKDVDAVRAWKMEQFRAQMKPQASRAMLAPMLAGMTGSLEALKDADGSTFVRFGAMFRNLKMTVGAFGGQWYLTRFPSQ